MKILFTASWLAWSVLGQPSQPNYDDESSGHAFLCRCELPGENIYEPGQESYTPLRIGHFYVLDENHESCKVSSTPVVDAVIHGIQHWTSFFTLRDDNDDHSHRNLLTKRNQRRKSTARNDKTLRSLSHDTGGVASTEKHGIAPFLCPDNIATTVPDPSSTPTPVPQAMTELPSVQVPTLDIIGTNETSLPPTDGSSECPYSATMISIELDDKIIGPFAEISFPWNITSCDDTVEERTAVWISINGTGDMLQASTCSPETSFLTSLQVVSGHCNNLTCVVENQDATGNCPSPNIFGSTVTWLSEPNELYWVLLFPRGNEAVSSFDQFGLTIASLPYEDTPVPTAAPIEDITGTTTLYPTAAPLANISPVYQGAFILDDNHSCDAAFRLVARNNTSNSILGTTIGAPNTTTCWNGFVTPTVWFSVIGTGQILEVTLSDRIIPFPPLLSVQSGVSCDDDQLECLATGLDTVAWQSSAGEVYRILLQGRVGTGDYGLMVRSFDN